MSRNAESATSTHRRTNSSTSSRGAVLKVSSGSPEKSSNDRFDTERGQDVDAPRGSRCRVSSSCGNTVSSRLASLEAGGRRNQHLVDDLAREDEARDVLVRTPACAGGDRGDSVQLPSVATPDELESPVAVRLDLRGGPQHLVACACDDHAPGGGALEDQPRTSARPPSTSSPFRSRKSATTGRLT